MNYKVASTLGEVLEAWCVVYKQYLAASLIHPNDFSIFTFPEYISNNTAVILGKKMNHTVCSISSVLDSDKGLPLDKYYKNTLDDLRNQGKKLIEIGLHADMRKSTSLSEITELMAAIARFGVHTDHHDYVIGVNPKRISFYQQVFGFNPIGEVTSYKNLKTAPVVLLHANGKSEKVASLMINSEIYCDPKHFDFNTRYRFNPNNFITPGEFGSSVETFIREIWKKTKLHAA